MIVRLVISADPVEKEEIRSLVEYIRRWENTCRRGEVTGILVQTEETQLTQSELDDLCGDLYPPGVVKAAETGPSDVSKEEDSLLHLGSRQVSIDGKLVGICDGIILTLGKDVTDADRQALQNGRAITMQRMGRG